MKKIMNTELPDNAVERVGNRTYKSKTFDVGGGKKRLLISRKPVHFYSGEGWEDINVTPRKEQSKFVVDKAPYTLSLDEKKFEITYTSRRGGTLTVSLLSIGGRKIMRFPTGEIRGNEVWFTNVVQGVDLYVQMKPAGFEIFKVVKSSEAPAVFEWQYIVDEKRSFSVADTKDTYAYDSMKRMVRMDVTQSESERLGNNKIRFTRTERMTSDVAIVKDLRVRNKKWGPGIVFPVLIDVSVNETIVANNDDGLEILFEFGPYGNWYTAGYANENFCGVNNYGGNFDNYNSGVRFQGVAVPQGATIDSAVIRVYATNAVGTTNVKLYGDDTDDAAEWAYNSDFENWIGPRDMTKTTASLSITSNPSTGTTTEYDVQAIVQEIVNRAGWVSGADMRFGFMNQLSTGKHGFWVDDYNKSGTNQADLDIEYTEAASGRRRVIISG